MTQAAETPHQAMAVQASPRNNGGSAVRRDMDLVRTILLRVEDAHEPLDLADLVEKDASEEDEQVVAHHVSLLVEQAGFMKGIDVSSHDGDNWIDLSLTWAGHEFLDNVRDPDVWRQTKVGAKKAGGFSLQILAKIAEAVVMDRVNKLVAGGLDG